MRIRSVKPAKKKAIPLATRRAVAVRAGCAPGGVIEARCHYCSAPGRIRWTTYLRRLPGYPERYEEVAGAWIALVGLELDHVIPECKGGSGAPDNIVLACRTCNRSKGHRDAPKVRR